MTAPQHNAPAHVSAAPTGAGAHAHGLRDHGREHARAVRGREHARRLAWVLALTSLYMFAEIAGAWLSNSLALFADAGHMLSDAAALALSLFAVWAATRPPRASSTFGYHRAEILAALVNGAVLLVIALFIFLEALERLRQPPEVQGALMLVVASGGLVMNLVGLRILSAGRSDNLNVRGAWLHVLSDALGSVGAIAAGAAIWAFGWGWADPLASLVIAIFVVHAAWALLRETVAVLMESAPGHIDVDQVRDALRAMHSVLEVHDLHVWTITSGMESLSAHIVARADADAPALLAAVREVCAARFGIDHVTIQIDRVADADCAHCT